MSHHRVFILILVVIASAHCVSLVRRNLQHFDGRNVTSGEQCITRGFIGACISPDPANVCLHMKCAKSVCHFPFSVDVGPALQGTSCGEKKICISGQCTDDPDPPPKLVRNQHNFVLRGAIIPCIKVSN